MDLYSLHYTLCSWWNSMSPIHPIFSLGPLFTSLYIMLFVEQYVAHPPNSNNGHFLTSTFIDNTLLSSWNNNEANHTLYIKYLLFMRIQGRREHQFNKWPTWDWEVRSSNSSTFSFGCGKNVTTFSMCQWEPILDIFDDS